MFCLRLGSQIAITTGAGGFDVSGNDLEQSRRRRTAIPRDLAPDQIDCLDTVGALIDWQDAGIAVMLGSAGFLDETHTAVDLHAFGSNGDATIGRP